MNYRFVIFVLMALCFAGNVAYSESDQLSSAQKKKLSALLKNIKKKQETAEPVKYEVTLPVAAAGVRGAKANAGHRLDVLWPESTITPLLALANNIQNNIEKGENAATMRAQLEDFLKVFPEFKSEKAVQDLSSALK